MLCSWRHVIRPLRCWRVVGVKLLLRRWVAGRGLVVPAGGSSVVAMGLGGLVVGSRGRGYWLLAPGCSVGEGEGEGGITYCIYIYGHVNSMALDVCLLLTKCSGRGQNVTMIEKLK